MADFDVRELFGGAIISRLPRDYIDASDLRQIPDHQEVFLSPKTLTSIIIEINQYVPSPDDAAAVHYHFKDVMPTTDRLESALASPTQVEMPAMKDYPAYFLIGTIIEPVVDKKVPSALPVEWQQAPATKEVKTVVYQLVVRMKKYETDLCVRINVPLKELDLQGKIKEEEDYVKGIMEEIVKSLEVKDFGLFGSE